ncbi:unnamed protein product, partial [Mesorhabditis spiculigera]
MSFAPLDNASWRSLIAFWTFGLCNTIPYILMLSAAEDIIDKDHIHHGHINGTCPVERGTQHCQGTKSTGHVLLADILPSLFIKIFVMFFLQAVPYWIRHTLVIISQMGALLIVATAKSYSMAILGVSLISAAGGLGESSMVSYSSHFAASTTIAWASGTGAAGMIGSILYAGMTEPHLGNLTAETALMLMLFFPIAYTTVFYLVLDHSSSLCLLCRKGKESSAPGDPEKSEKDVEKSLELVKGNWMEKAVLIKSLLRFAIPLILVYMAEYTINQGFTQLIVFDCANGMGLTAKSQYRWFQVVYRAGTFISKSSLSIIDFPVWVLYLLPVLQVGNAIFFYLEALFAFLPHIAVAFSLICMEGLMGGSSLVKTFSHIHKNAKKEDKEFSLAVMTTSDSIGIVGASFLAIWLHNLICQQLEWRVM